MQDIVQQYKARNEKKETDRKAKYFSVSKQEIETNDYDLSVSKYKEEVYEEVVYEKPNVIIEKLESIESNIQIGLIELKELL